MQIIYPSIRSAQNKLRNRRKRKKLSFNQWVEAREKLQIAKWKHKGVPGYAQF